MAPGLTLIYIGGEGGRGKVAPLGSFLLQLKNGWHQIAETLWFLLLAYYTSFSILFWSPGTQAVAMVTRFLTGVWLKDDQNRCLIVLVCKK